MTSNRIKVTINTQGLSEDEVKEANMLELWYNLSLSARPQDNRFDEYNLKYGDRIALQ